tara:strand:- start:9 stop:185 length:177 start_codon:yes stop_codon:yes gene_type:complete
VQIGDLVIVENTHLGIIVKIINDARFKEGILHLKVHFIETNETAWHHAFSLKVLSSKT